MLIRALAVLVMLVVFSMPSSATVRVTNDMGGLMTEYAANISAMHERGEKVVFDGPCYSACTMALGLPRDQICVTSNAVFGFHAAWNIDDNGKRVTSASGTQALIDVYPPRIRSWLAQRGGLSPRMKYLRGSELVSMGFARCGSAMTRAQTKTLPRATRGTGYRAARNH